MVNWSHVVALGIQYFDAQHPGWRWFQVAAFPLDPHNPGHYVVKVVGVPLDQSDLPWIFEAQFSQALLSEFTLAGCVYQEWWTSSAEIRESAKPFVPED